MNDTLKGGHGGGRFPICAYCFAPVPPGAVRREERAPTTRRPERVVIKHLHTPCAVESDHIAEMGRRFEELVPEPRLATAVWPEEED